MNSAEHRAALILEIGRIASLPESALEAPVPTCPGWNVEQLIGHLGGVHHWATAFLEKGLERARHDLGTSHLSGPAIFEWYARSVDGLIAQIDRHDPSEQTRSTEDVKQSETRLVTRSV